MPKFLAVHTIPNLSKERWIQVANEMAPKLPKGFSWSQTYCDFENSKFFCIWEAPDRKQLDAGLKSLFIPVDAVYPVEVFDVTKLEFGS